MTRGDMEGAVWKERGLLGQRDGGSLSRDGHSQGGEKWPESRALSQCPANLSVGRGLFWTWTWSCPLGIGLPTTRTMLAVQVQGFTTLGGTIFLWWTHALGPCTGLLPVHHVNSHASPDSSRLLPAPPSLCESPGSGRAPLRLAFSCGAECSSLTWLIAQEG